MIGMYPLLPTMKGATAKILLQAIEELKEHYRYDDRALVRRLVWFRTLLERAETVPPQDKVRVQERLTMLDNLLEQAEFVQEIKRRAAEEAAEEAEARVAAERARVAELEARLAAEAESREDAIQTTQEMVVGLVETRFPSLVKLAQERAQQIRKLEALKQLGRLLRKAPDEATARFVLETYTA